MELKVVDVKPKLKLVEDVKPNLTKVNGETVVYTELRTILAGQPIGLLLTLTYPIAITNFTANRE